MFTDIACMYWAKLSDFGNADFQYSWKKSNWPHVILESLPAVGYFMTSYHNITQIEPALA